MAIATFAHKTFSVSRDKIYTLQGITSSCSLNIEEQEVEGSKPSTYIKNAALKQLSFNLELRQQTNVDVEYEKNDWMTLCESATPYMLLIGGRPFCSNKMLLTSVSEQEAELDGSGRYIKSKLQLEFKEFERWGAKKEEAGTKAGDKKGKKRKNKNKDEAEALGPEDEAKLNSLDSEIFGG